MFKLLVAVITFLLLSQALMGLRQHRRELESQTAAIMDQIELRKHRLWDQRPQITSVASPTSLAKTMQEKGLAGQVGVVEKSRPKVNPDNPGDLIAPLRQR
jgi:hypothetical protein